MDGATEGGWTGTAALGGLLLALLLLEAIAPIHRAPREEQGRLIANFGLGLLNAALFAALPLSSVLAATWAARHDLGLFNFVAIPGPAAFAMTILLRSLLAYILHVATHRVPILWRMHRIHHTDTAVDLSTGFRHHPLELLFVAACYGAFAAGLGLSPAALIAYEASAVALTLWTHANLRLPHPLERALALLVVTPAMHHVHHSARQSETDSNYGELLSLWDRLFGTLRRLDQDGLATMPIGLGPVHDRDAARLLRQLALPFRSNPSAGATAGLGRSHTEVVEDGLKPLPGSRSID